MNNQVEPPYPARSCFGIPARRLLGALACAVFSVFAAHAAEIPAADAQQPASPDWRDQIIYFVMIDRFDDGDPRNNDQGAGEFDPADSRRYSGGDLAGITRRLDYIRGLGATALWMTPPTRHQWWDEAVGYGGYHGYWPQHFMEIDPHFGTLADYRALANGLHGRDMLLVHDVVVNHTGNYIRYPEAHDPRAPEHGFELNDGSRPTQAPTQWPFSANDARDPQQRGLDIYHWNRTIRDFADPVQRLDWQMADLDDLNTENPLVRRALRASYGFWIREVGVDAFRVDTAFYVPPDYFRDFLYADDPAAPGILEVARRSGREDFLLFGEGFAIDAPFEDSQAQRIEAYTRDPEGPLLPSMINFPLYGSTLDVFARGMPPAVLAHRIESMLRVHADPNRMPSFIDNHDVERFLASGSEAGLKQALLLIMTLPGIPVIYYGTEQGFKEMRASMFAAGWGAQGRDHFDTDGELYRYIAGTSALRHSQAALRRGRPRLLAAEGAGPGALVYLSEHQGETVVTALNNGAVPNFTGAIETGLAPGSVLRPLFAIEGEAPSQTVDVEGRIDLLLPGHSGYVWRVDAAEAQAPAPTAAVRPRLQPLSPAPATTHLRVRGEGMPNTAHQLVLDGELQRATVISSDEAGRLEAELDVRGLSDPRLRHRLQLRAPDNGLGSTPLSFSVRPHWTERARVQDPADDDRGPEGRYRYPLDPGWAAENLLDLRELIAETSGGSLRLQVGLGDLSRSWNPANGFDRIALTVYIELPGAEDGATVMPLQNDELPAGLRWHRRLRVHGWSNQIHTADGADAGREGHPVGSAAIEVDRESRSLRLTLPARSLGELPSLAGARIYVTTWDYDSGYRPLDLEAGLMRFGGGDGARDPLWMDAALLELDGSPESAE